MIRESELPKGWAWSSLGELGEYVNGRGFSKSEWSTTGRPIIRIQDLTGTGDAPNYFAGEVEEKYLVRSGDLLVSWAATLGAYIWRGPEGWLNQHIFKVQSCIDQIFHYYLIQATLLDLYAQTHGSGMVHITRGKFDSTLVKLPPLAEQRRIVAAIEEHFTRLDAAVAALRRVHTALKRYRAAVLKAAVEGRLTEAWRAEHPDAEPASALLARILAERRACWEADQRAKGKYPAKARYEEPAAPDVTDLPKLPNGWCWASMNQLAGLVRNGLSPKPESSPPGHRILRINAVRPLRVDLSQVRYLRLPDEDVTDYLLKDGDILFTRYNGSLDFLGVAGMVRGCTEQTLHPDKLIRVQTVAQGPLPMYLEVACNVGVSRNHIEGRARTTAGQTGISGFDIKQMPIPLPPLAEQAEIAAEVDRRLSVVSEVEGTVEANLKRAERLRQAILEQAFTGRLVPQYPSDEPASNLLGRIRQQRTDVPRNGRSTASAGQNNMVGGVNAPIPAGSKQARLWNADE